MENCSLPDLSYNYIAAKHLDNDIFNHLHNDSEGGMQVYSEQANFQNKHISKTSTFPKQGHFQNKAISKTAWLLMVLLNG